MPASIGQGDRSVCGQTLLLSDQGAGRLYVFTRAGTAANPHEHTLRAVIPMRALDTDGVEVASRPVGRAFPESPLVMKSDGGAFHYYDWRDVQRLIDSARAATP